MIERNFDVIVETKDPKPLKLIILDQIMGLPAHGGAVQQLPETVIPFSQASLFSWKTTIIKRYEL